MAKRSTRPPDPPAEASALHQAPTTPPPPDYDDDAEPPSARPTVPPAVDYSKIRESCSEFAVLAGGAAFAFDAAAVPDDSHLVFAAVLTGDELDWFSLSEASLAFLRALDGHSPVRDIAARLAMDRVEVCDLAHNLLAHGIIRLRVGG